MIKSRIRVGQSSRKETAGDTARNISITSVPKQIRQDGTRTSAEFKIIAKQLMITNGMSEHFTT